MRILHLIALGSLGLAVPAMAQITPNNSAEPSNTRPGAMNNAPASRGNMSDTMSGRVTTGMTVRDSSGATIGEVARVEPGTDGAARRVLVRVRGGGTTLVPLDASDLTVSGGAATTTRSKDDLMKASNPNR